MSRADQLEDARRNVAYWRDLVGALPPGSPGWRSAHEELDWWQGRAAMLATDEGWA